MYITHDIIRRHRMIKIRGNVLGQDIGLHEKLPLSDGTAHGAIITYSELYNSCVHYEYTGVREVHAIH